MQQTLRSLRRSLLKNSNYYFGKDFSQNFSISNSNCTHYSFSTSNLSSDLTGSGRRGRSKKEEPKSQNFANTKPSQSQTEFKANNQYSEKGMPEPDEENINLIPPGLSIKQLYWPPTKTNILLLGVERRNLLHGSFLNDIMSKINVDAITIQIAPDQPYFIRSDGNYKKTWKKFICGQLGLKFVLNPNPKVLSDTILDEIKLKQFMEGPVFSTPEAFEVGSNFIYSLAGPSQTSQVVDCLLTPFLYAYNNTDKKINLIANDVPILTQRDYLAYTMPTKKLKDVVNDYIDSLEIGESHNDNFNPQLLDMENFILPRIKYITESLRHTCYTAKNVLAVVEGEFADLIEDEWKDLPPKLRNLSDCYMPMEKKGKKVSFSEYIERHVMLDIVFEPFVKENFVKFNSFPFSGSETLGKEVAQESVFMIWDHYHKRYTKQIKDRNPNYQDFTIGGKVVVEDPENVEKAFR